MIVEEDRQLEPGFQWLVPGMKVAVTSDWFGIFKQKYRKNAPSSLIKKMLDSFFNPWDLALCGGRSEMEKDSATKGLAIKAIEGK